MALNYHPSVGGAQSHVREVAEGLVARGHQVTVLTSDSMGTPGGSDERRIAVLDEVIDGVRVRRFGADGWLAAVQHVGRVAYAQILPHLRDPERPIPLLLHGPASPRLAVAVRRALETDDVVVAVSSPYLQLLVTPYLRRRRRAAIVAMPLLHLDVRLPGRILRHVLRRYDGCTASTRREREVQVRAGVSERAVALLPPGVHPDDYPERTATEARAHLGLAERTTVGYVGRLARYKGVDTFLDAAALLWRTRPDLQVLVAGSPAGWNTFDALAEAAGRIGGDRLVVRRSFANEDKALLLSACDVVTCPSREESFGMVTAEAWAARRPVVAGAIDTVRDVVRRGVDADLVDPGDAPALAAAIDALLDDPARADAYGRAGRARVEQELSWSTVVDGWDRFLTDVVARRGVSERAAA